MTSTRALAIEVVVSPTTSKVSQSPSQKSNWRYSDAGHLPATAARAAGTVPNVATARQRPSGTLSMIAPSEADWRASSRHGTETQLTHQNADAAHRRGR